MTEKERIARVSVLTSSWLDGIISDPEKAELHDLLQGDPDACEHYLDLVEMHATLATQMEGESAAEQIGQLIDRPKPEKKLSVRNKYILAPLALVGGLVLLLISIFFPPGSTVDEEPLARGGGVAVVSRLVGDISSVSEGDEIRPGRFAIESGFAQLEFFCGSTVILEGPAELDIRSMWLAVCHRGRLRVSVPEPAKGFTIETADFKAVDLGTEFAMSVTPRGRSEVHVIEGEVRLDDLAGKQLAHLTGGMGVRTGGTTDLENLAADPETFVGRRQLQDLASDTSKTAFDQWYQTTGERRADESVLLYFDFEDQEPWDRKLLNQSRPGSNAAIIGAQWSTGRWAEKQALDFSRVSDRVRLYIPGEYESLTLAASIHIRSFDRWLSSLILTDDHDEGELHWQISDKGELILGIAGAQPGINAYSPPVIHPDDLGRWVHVAVTVDRPTRTVIHYLNGTEVARHVKKVIPALRFGSAEIGNWQTQAGSSPIRSFNGRIDEFLIYNKVLSPDEIKVLSQGK
ncbi:MAG: FecR domain-containing protein [Verrucomicrobiales bacterium]|nr:FecR domain-containing protein [Verrucomicrobiales bacterium]